MERECKPTESESSGPHQESCDRAVLLLTVNGKPYKRHERHWYEEGNCCFILGDTAFRLHRSILSGQSSVLAGLLSDPKKSPVTSIFESETSNNKNDGGSAIPTLLLDDKAEDFAHVLDFIYPKTLPKIQTEHLKSKDLMGIVKFTRKYRIDGLGEWAVKKLRATPLLQTKDSSVQAALEAPTLYGDPRFCVELVHFSRDCSLPEFLPLAFYALAMMEWDQNSRDVTCLDQISSEDRNRVHKGRLAINKAVLEKMAGAPDRPHKKENCTRDNCRSTVWEDPSTRWAGLMLHPLEELEARLKCNHSSFCADCKENDSTQTRTFRDDLMGRLTEFFKLKPGVVGGTPEVQGQTPRIARSRQGAPSDSQIPASNCESNSTPEVTRQAQYVSFSRRFAGEPQLPTSDRERSGTPEPPRPSLSRRPRQFTFASSRVDESDD